MFAIRGGIILVLAICAMLIAACGKKESVREAAGGVASTKAAGAAGPKDSALKIKGLYPGMDIQAVPDAFMDLLSEQRLSNLGFTGVIQYDNGEQCVLLYDKQFLRAIEARMRERYDQARAQRKVDEELQVSCYASDGVLAVKSGADGRVIRIEFNAVGELFNARKMPAAEFARLLVNEYKIPGLMPNAEHNGWSYAAPGGIQVEVLDRKVFGVSMPRLVMSRTVP